MKNFQLQAKILAQTKIKNSYWRCTLRAAPIARLARPGQFVNIKISAGLTPLLRRPFSIHGISGDKLTLLYEVVGQGTQILAQKKAGESLDIIGPLGNGFELKSARPALIVAGGMGAAPLLFLATKVKTLVLVGAKTKEQLLCVQEFKKSGCRVKISTDDGSAGFKGRVSELLKHNLAGYNTIYACGPKPMLKAVAEVAKKYKLPAQLSLEEHMACGIGACLGCVVKTKDGLRRVCKEGPVFLAEDLIW
ncbi:MAG: dihydroorotate dehydrogenase electron transfer subunit [Candidatus Omnitrophica bacterium]|nr:dihydroorotate dehydrogenase electron transfer subunit [Candidatus Omnitrophota bacterium]